jgi:neutral ceramidase
MMFSGTHTHSSVSAITNKDPSLDYRSFIISRVVDGVRRAVNNLEPARIAWGSGKVPQHVFNRRWLLKEGVTNPNPFGGKDRAVMNPSSLVRPRSPDLPDRRIPKCIASPCRRRMDARSRSWRTTGCTTSAA